MNLTFEDAARGVNKDISVNITDLCPKCNGKKHEPGKGPISCPACHGTGMVSCCILYVLFIYQGVFNYQIIAMKANESTCSHYCTLWIARTVLWKNIYLYSHLWNSALWYLLCCDVIALFVQETVSQGPFVMRTTCRSCGGTRQYIAFKCQECSG